MQFQELLHNARSFYEQADSDNLESSRQRNIIASILFSWIAMEAFVNDMMEDFVALPPGIFTIHERGFLQERLVEFSTEGVNAGDFIIANRRRFVRLGDKILFLTAKFGKGTKLDKGSTLWQKFEASKNLRDRLTHPRKDQEINVSLSDAEDALEVAQEVIRLVALKVWNKNIDV